MLMGGLGAGEQAVAVFPAGTQRAVLRLQAVREEDAGQYVCEALSDAGVTFDVTVLDVGCKSLLLLLGPTEHSSLSPPFSPRLSSCLLLPKAALAPAPGFPSAGVSVLSTSRVKPGGISKG